MMVLRLPVVVGSDSGGMVGVVEPTPEAAQQKGTAFKPALPAAGSSDPGRNGDERGSNGGRTRGGGCCCDAGQAAPGDDTYRSGGGGGGERSSAGAAEGSAAASPSVPVARVVMALLEDGDGGWRRRRCRGRGGGDECCFCTFGDGGHIRGGRDAAGMAALVVPVAPMTAATVLVVGKCRR